MKLNKNDDPSCSAHWMTHERKTRLTNPNNTKNLREEDHSLCLTNNEGIS